MRNELWRYLPRGLLLASAIGLSLACAAPQRNQPPQQTQLAQAVAAPDRPYPPEPLSGPVLSILRSRMADHARGMGGLVATIMLLKYDEIREDALRIAGDASLARPLTGDATELASALPEKFFLYQDALRIEAKTLADAAGREQPYDVADSYGRLSQICVRCHATFRPGR